MALEFKVDKYLGMAIFDFKTQFQFQQWKTMIWCMSILSMGLSHLENADYSVFNNLICSEIPQIYQSLIPPGTDITREQLILLSDLLTMIEKVTKSSNDQSQQSFLSKDIFINNFVMDMMRTKNMKILFQCIEIAGTLVCYNDKLPQKYIQAGLIPIVKEYFSYANSRMKQEMLWLLSNIIVNSEADALCCLDSSLIFNIVMTCNSSVFTLRKEALWCVTNLCNQLKDEAKINSLLDYDIVSILVSLLDREMSNSSISLLAVSSLKDLITKSDKCLEVFIRLRGEELLKETELANPFSEVCTMCSELINSYFSRNDEMIIDTSTSTNVGASHFQLD